MSNTRQLSSSRFERPSCKRRMRRLIVETLERRECPAVMFDFEGGVLRVTGDDGPNSVEIFQSRDGVVQVTGDGEQHRFERVERFIVVTGDGPDTINVQFNPKELAVEKTVSWLFDVGDDNDQITIDDGGPRELRNDQTRQFTLVQDMVIDLGAGRDELTVDLHDTDRLDLDLRSDDGSDRILIGMLLPAVQKVREAAARIDFDLVGSDNNVDVRMENIDNVDLSIVSETPVSEPVTGGTIDVYWHVINNGSGRQPRNDGVVILFSSLPGGSAVPPTIGVSPTSFSFSATAGGASPSRAAVAITAGSGDDAISIHSRNVDEFLAELNTGDGDDTIVVDAEVAQSQSKGGLSRAVGDIDSSFDSSFFLGAGNDRLEIETDGFAKGDIFINADDGDDEVLTKHRWLSIVDRSQLNLVILLGGGSDTLAIDAAGYREVKMALESGPQGDGSDRISAIVQSLHRNGRKQTGRVVLDSGMDVYGYQIQGYQFRGYQPTPTSVEWVFVAE